MAGHLVTWKIPSHERSIRLSLLSPASSDTIQQNLNLCLKWSNSGFVHVLGPVEPMGMFGYSLEDPISISLRTRLRERRSDPGSPQANKIGR